MSSTPATWADNIGLRAGKSVYSYEGWWGYDSMPIIYSTNGSEYQTGNWAEEIIGNAGKAIGYYERCLKYPPIGKGVLYNLGVLYEDNEQYDKAAECYRRLNKSDPLDERALRAFVGPPLEVSFAQLGFD